MGKNEPSRPKPKANLLLVRKVLFLVIAVSLSFSAGFIARDKGYSLANPDGVDIVISRDLPPTREDLDFSLFWKVWDELENNYFDKKKLDPATMVYGAIEGMVAAVGDPYTVFLPPNENKVVQEDLTGSFEGVGIQIGFRGTQLAVISPLTDSPAEKAGLLPGDFIVRIQDEAKGIDIGTAGTSLHDAVMAIRGKKGTQVILTILRDGEEGPFEVPVVRERIDVPSVVLTFVGEDESIAHISIFQFTGETEQEWEKVLRDVLTKPALSGVILDLRNNPGGFLNTSVYIASEFLPQGEVVVREEGSANDQEYLVDRLGRLRTVPTVVMINGGSASASEILAGALRDVADVQLVGETSFGKGTIQESLQVNGGAALHITTSKWITPGGTWVNEDQLVPDVEIKDDPETEEDEQLQKALEIISP